MGKEFVFFLSKMTTDKRDTTITLRVSQSEKLAWQAKADLVGMTLSNLIRQAISRTKTWTVADKSLVKEQTRQIARIGNNLNQIAKWANTYKSTAEAVEIIQALRLIEQSLSRLSTTQPSSSNHSENSNDVS
ncbi:hypothetical protein CY0110_00885 [Crocosphaera chwakensis CCY0110]|uniref:Bacterial mobilisation domain-containing protein n=2 Tax=Crocosphaera TaxID=263510 RepID=A3J023_9CHRO|nr:hypothetical protein CY0110_00885 [Crocosphaera chwakensis CCY0110]